jgi:diacylglycerol kinase (ATP)
MPLPPLRQAALIYNPRSGRQRHGVVLGALVAVLRAGGFAVEPVPTGSAGDATRLARELAAGGRVDTVFSFGGDGTAREVAAGLLGSSVALGFLPGGTANLLAIALGLPRDPVGAAAALCRGAVRPFDVGLAGGSPFLMMVSAGLDAHVLSRLETRHKWRFGKGAIALQGLADWWGYGYPAVELTVDGEPLAATFAAVCNIPFYGGAFRLAPGALTDDGRLELVAFQGRGRAATLGFAADLLRAAHVNRPDVVYRPAGEVLFSAPDGAAVQVDGDVCAERLPLQVRLAPERLLMLTPA